jgi:hypothetical protein
LAAPVHLRVLVSHSRNVYSSLTFVTATLHVLVTSYIFMLVHAFLVFFSWSPFMLSYSIFIAVSRSFMCFTLSHAIVCSVQYINIHKHVYTHSCVIQAASLYYPLKNPWDDRLRYGAAAASILRCAMCYWVCVHRVSTLYTTSMSYKSFIFPGRTVDPCFSCANARVRAQLCMSACACVCGWHLWFWKKTLGGSNASLGAFLLLWLSHYSSCARYQQQRVFVRAETDISAVLCACIYACVYPIHILLNPLHARCSVRSAVGSVVFFC